jgi:competence protein ComFC
MNLLDFIYPKTCLGCGKSGQYICVACIKLLPTLIGHGLVKGTNSIWPYGGVIRKAILALKYKYVYDIASELAELIVEVIKNINFFPENIILTPVPLHPSRENYRGFNQAGEVGKLVAKKLGWQYVPDLLIRKIATASQTTLNAEKRMENIRGAFIPNTKYHLHDTGYSVVIFDDVLTTGSTINEARRVLLAAGFPKVFGLTIAK